MADAFRSKKSSSVLLFMNSKYHKSDAFQVTLQLLMVIARETYTRKQAVYTHKWTHTHTHTHTERNFKQEKKIIIPTKSYIFYFPGSSIWLILQIFNLFSKTLIVKNYLIFFCISVKWQIRPYVNNNLFERKQ